jgi:diguanylate cyclase (GGDEF)-like protein
MTMRILLVEDDSQFTHLLKSALVAQHYIVDIASDGQDGWERVRSLDYDLIVLDVDLPKLDGISFCRQLRAKGNQVLVMLLTAKGTSNDKVLGLDAGADDYVVKPVVLSEVEARIRALLRRNIVSGPSVLQWGELQLNPSTCEVAYRGTSLNLTTKEHTLLELFLRNSQRIYSQSAILDRLWSLEDEPPGEDAVRTHIKRLRQKLKAVGAAELIETVYGLGYRLNVAYRKEPEDSLDAPVAPVNQFQPRPSDPKQTAIDKTWETNQLNLVNRTFILEQAAQALVQGRLSEDLQRQAQQEAHKLIGSLGMLGLGQAADMARQIETLLRLPTPELLLEGRQSLPSQVMTLRQLLANLVVPALEQGRILNGRNAARLNPREFQSRLLIVTGSEIFANQLLLEGANHRLETAIAANIQTAKSAIERVRPDLVWLDLSLPDIRKDGLAWVKALSQQTPPIPALITDSCCQNPGQITLIRGKSRCILEKNISVSNAIAQALEPVRMVEAKIVVLDDDVIVLRLLRAILEPWGLQVVTLNHPKTFLDELETLTPDLLVLDVQMPSIDGIELCQMLRNDIRWAWLPILFLTGSKDLDTIQCIFAAGADDYVSKPVVAPELITRILNRLERTRLLRKQAELDSLTGLLNRACAERELTKFLQAAEQDQQSFCLVVLEINALKQVNFQYGHQIGDQVVRQVAHVLHQELHEEEVASRWEGGEFVIGFSGMNCSEARKWLENICSVLSQTKLQTPDGNSMPITLNAGLASYSEDGTTLQELYRAAVRPRDGLAVAY